jgi:hypothetical protein
MPRKKATSQEPRVTTVRLPEEWYEYLRTRAFHERTTITDLIRAALKDQFDLKDPPPPDEGNKGGERRPLVYPAGGLPAMRTCDR